MIVLRKVRYKAMQIDPARIFCKLPTVRLRHQVKGFAAGHINPQITPWRGGLHGFCAGRRVLGDSALAPRKPRGDLCLVPHIRLGRHGRNGHVQLRV